MRQQDDDYWLNLSDTFSADEGAGESEHGVLIEEIGGVVPLDAQFGVWPTRTTPEALHEPLFGDLRSQRDETAPLNTYAILDAVKFIGGASEFDECDLPSKCLFKGEMAEQLRDVAPYLFELSDAAELTRRLMTHLPDKPSTLTSLHMWGADPGIYIRSGLAFDEIWLQFRKFTRIRDARRAWLYFRFWEPRVLRKLVERLSNKPKHWLWRMFDGVEAVVLVHTGKAFRVTVPQTYCELSRGLKICAEDIFDDLSAVQHSIFCEDLAVKLGDEKALSFSLNEDGDLASRISDLSMHANSYGLKDRKSVERYIVSCHIFGKPAEAIPEAYKILQENRHELDRSRQLLNFAFQYLENRSGRM
ncbi:DUF4123 domain-containing protein [Tritonibacter mobilis]|uniref:DUF4123 domain-containing protein n=1 Tax=Tritonibacter mobilis F1926 TaxID=1265309 RepID=A0A1B1A8U5_9RHOB|nr:DUF4123 domain-containing protein [Tritonibacter mobilis]ANP42947.1 hypothetical protein K529_019475 [Tritonibacter mobilis F1926]KJZ21633.1 hypothetical protein TW79_21730 [Tritonibacter mobilis]